MFTLLRSGSLEADNELNYITNKALVISIVFTSVSFLESLINEVFMDSYDNESVNTFDLAPDQIKKIYATLWRKGIPRSAKHSVIDKYQIALSVIGLPEIDLGEVVGQDTIKLIKLRNALVHYEPESNITLSPDKESLRSSKLERQLKGRFELNQFTGANNPFFPDKCLSVDCARWAIETALNFSDEYFRINRKIPLYQRVKYLVLKNKNNSANTAPSSSRR